MNRSHFRPNLTLLTGIVALLLIASPPGTAQDATSTLSGRVVDVDGNPVSGIPIALRSAIIIHGDAMKEVLGRLRNISDAKRRINLWSQPQTETDEAGHFSITNIVSGPIQVMVAPQIQMRGNPNFEPDSEILSLKIGKMTFYPTVPAGFHGIPFAIDAGAQIENVVVTVKPRMRIRGQIVFADGTPLANAQVQVDVLRQDVNGGGIGTSSGGAKTDHAGYFVEYVDKPGFYTVAVEFQGLSTTSEEFILETGQRREDLVLTFDSEPIPIEPVPGQVEPDGTRTWVVNPANDHAYRSVRCKSWDDAQTKAVAEDAHLVSINDAAEQKWLAEIFGPHPYWIGLTDFAKEGEWEWTSGEPVNYTNWISHKPMDADRGDEDYVFMGLSLEAQWHSVGPGSPKWRVTRMAILERDSLPAKLPLEDK